ncbi:MAG: tRNA pseudouridine(13) synthase TruD [Planctomycetes bacterium]|nr:tRNA pseudouridine(13) synthase TruD [Planctomycetota bacterium]
MSESPAEASRNPFPSPLCRRTLLEAAPLAGRIKLRPEDFLVEELPLFDLTGAGEHVHLGVQKIGLRHDELIAIVADHCGVSPRAVGYAGMKDKRAITQQSLSIHLPGRADPPPLDHPNVRILWSKRHQAKLRVGQLLGNRFAIRLRGIDPSRIPGIHRDLYRLARTGVPNAFGPQRFGYRLNGHWLGRFLALQDWQGFLDELLGASGSGFPPQQRERRETYHRGEFRSAIAGWARSDFAERAALKALSEGASPREAVLAIKPQMRDFWICALQSAIFNAVLDQRLQEGTFDEFMPGDLAFLHEGGAIFRITQAMLDNPQEKASLKARLLAFEISPSGPLAGPSVMWGEGSVLQCERNAIAHFDLDPQVFLDPKFEPPGSRRALRIALTHPQAESGADEHGDFIRLAFDLPRGAYATNVLQELFGGGIVEEYG